MRHADRQHDEYAQDHLAQNVASSFHTSSLLGERQRAGRMLEIKAVHPVKRESERETAKKRFHWLAISFVGKRDYL
jgi:hypothetical protein